MLALFGTLLALGLLVYFAFRGASVIVLGPVMALVAVLFSPGLPLLATYTQVYMPALGRFIIAYFPLFLLGAVFGRLMDDSGYARAIAGAVVRWLGPGQAILATVLACAVLTYGGVSLFVVAFAVYPVANALFRAGAVPKRLLPAAIALGAFTFTMTALPGTPAIQNAIPMPYFGTTPFAAPGIGVIAGLIMGGFGVLYLTLTARKATARGEGYGAAGAYKAAEPDAELRTQAHDKGFDLRELGDSADEKGVAIARALSPILLVLTLNYALSVEVFPALDTGYLASAAYGATTIEAVRGVWAIICALTAGILLVLALRWRQLASPKRSLVDGANAAVLPIFNTASLVGFGAVVAGLPAFETVRATLAGLGGDPVVSLAISASVLAGLTGSASGGMSIALEALGETYRQEAAAAGTDPALLHRVTALATGGLDALPHNGAVVT